MSRIPIFMILIACPAMVFGQGSVSRLPVSPMHPAAGYGGSGWDSDWCAAQTAPGAALQGTAQVIGAAGQYNQATSAAAVNMTQAESNALRNQVQGVQTFWEMRDLGSMERERQRGPRATPEELARRAHAAAPRPLSASQMDLVSGVLYWPAALQSASFADQRAALDEYAVRWAKYGALNYDDKTQVRENVKAMFGSLKSQIASIPPQDYVESRAFLESLLYATTRAIL